MALNNAIELAFYWQISERIVKNSERKCEVELESSIKQIYRD